MINETSYKLGTQRSAIRELFEYGNARAAIVGKENVLDFSLGNPSIPAPKEINETICQLLNDTHSLALHGYTSATGDLACRQAVAEDLNRRFDAGVKAEELFITCGAAPGLCAALRALAFPGAEIIALAPYFPEYKVFTQQAGATFQVVPPQAPDFQINFPALEETITENTAAIIVNSPNNPAGTVYTAETLEKLADLLTKKAAAYGHPIYIISDEPYRELVYDGAVVPFIPKLYRNTLVCYSWSKSLSLPGERIGYVYVPTDATDGKAVYAALCGAARELGHVCAPSLWQKVIARCVSLPPDLAAYDKNRRTLYQGLLAQGYEVAKPQGAFYLFVKAPGADSAAFCKKAMEKDLLIVPGDSFGCPDYFRLCYCVSLSTIEKALSIFRELITQ